jgi:hypothetical protein
MIVILLSVLTPLGGADGCGGATGMTGLGLGGGGTAPEGGGVGTAVGTTVDWGVVCVCGPVKLGLNTSLAVPTTLGGRA